MRYTSQPAECLLDAFKTYKYPNEIRTGVCDIHSPSVPAVAEMKNLLQLARERLVDG